MPQQLPLIVYQSAEHMPPSRLHLCDLPAEERPLYRLQQHGRDVLSTTELLALLLTQPTAQAWRRSSLPIWWVTNVPRSETSRERYK